MDENQITNKQLTHSIQSDRREVIRVQTNDEGNWLQYSMGRGTSTQLR